MANFARAWAIYPTYAPVHFNACQWSICVWMKLSPRRNARFCAVRSGLSASDIGRYKLNRTCFADKTASYLPAGFMDRSCFAYEVIVIREGQLTLMHHNFSREEADEIITYLVTGFYVILWQYCRYRIHFTVYFILFFYILCVCVCVLLTTSITFRVHVMLPQQRIPYHDCKSVQ